MNNKKPENKKYGNTANYDNIKKPARCAGFLHEVIYYSMTINTFITSQFNW